MSFDYGIPSQTSFLYGTGAIPPPALPPTSKAIPACPTLSGKVVLVMNLSIPLGINLSGNLVFL